MRHAIGYSSIVTASTLSGGSWRASYPITEFELSRARDLFRVARSTTAANADSIIDMDHGSAKTAQILFIPAHNLTSAATIILDRGTTAGASDVYAGTEVTCWPFAPLDGDYNGQHFGVCVIMPTANSARYTRIRIKDATNPAGYVQVSRPFLGPMWCPQYGVTKLDADWMPTYSSVERTESGTDWVHKRPPLRHASIAYGVLSNTEASELHEIIRLHDTSTEVVYVADRYDRAVMQQYGFLALFRELSKFEYPWWTHQGIALGFDQRGGAPAV